MIAMPIGITGVLVWRISNENTLRAKGTLGCEPVRECSRRDLNPCQKLERLLSLATRLRERGAALRVGPT